MPRKTVNKTVKKPAAKTATKRTYTKRATTAPIEQTPIIVNPQRSFLDRYAVFILIIGLFLFIMFKDGGVGCNKPGKADTVTITKTEYIQQPPVYIPQYIPVITETKVPTYIPPQYQPSSNQAELLKQYQGLVQEHFAENRYLDSIKLKDSSGKQVGIVNLNDVISQNKIKSREPSYQLSFPHTTTTTTITKEAPPKNMGFVGIGLTGNLAMPVNGAVGKFTWKDKKDRLYDFQAGGQLINGQVQPQFGIGTSWKISFGKK